MPYSDTLKILESFTNEIYYILGLFAADGYVGNDRDWLRMYLGQKEGNYKLMDSIALYLNLSLYGGSSYLNGIKYNKVYVKTGSEVICKFFLNLFGYNKSKTWDSFKDLKEANLSAFISGYIDGDGSISLSENKPVVIFCCYEESIRALIKYFLDKVLDLSFYEVVQGSIIKYCVANQKDVKYLHEFLYKIKFSLEYKKENLSKFKLCERFASLTLKEDKALNQDLILLGRDASKVQLNELTLKYGVAYETLLGRRKRLRLTKGFTNNERNLKKSKALELRNQGMDFDQIGQLLLISSKTVKRYLGYNA